jgi:ATP diphosphatase
MYGERTARVGFDWTRPEEVAQKVREEMAEVESARTPEEVEAEIGDLLFAVANWARHLGVEPETALRKANAASPPASGQWRNWPASAAWI